MSARSRLRSLGRLLRFRGPGYALYLVTGCLVPRLARDLLFACGPRRLAALAAAVTLAGLAVAGWASSVLFGAAKGAVATLLVTLTLAAGAAAGRWRHRRRRLTEAREAAATPAGFFLSWTDWPVDAAVRRAVDAAVPPPEAPRGEIVLGRIDGDGRLSSPWGELPQFEPVAADEFVARTRFDLDLVLLDGRVLIRKDYRGRRAEMLAEWHALGRLRGRANVPGVWAACEERGLLYRSFIPGDTLNDLLVRCGARIRLVETRGDQALGHLDGVARLEEVLERGTRLLGRAVPPGVLAELERQLDRIHRAGVARLSLTFGNVVLEPASQAPWLVDFDGAETYASTSSALFAFRRDQDRVKLNRFYDRDLLTEAGARALLREHFRSTYAPLDLGGGLVTRGFWSVDSGTGRWELLLRDALAGLIEGRRVLDLGSHHGLLPLAMLAAGARQVVAVERSPELVAMARHLHRLFEWRHMDRIALELRCADMRAVLDGDWGRFDLVTAFCSLYYLEREDMRRLVRRCAELAPVLVLQAKVDTRGGAARGKAEKSSPAFLQALLEANGYPRIEIVAPPGYTRPLLIGRRGGETRG